MEKALIILNTFEQLQPHDHPSSIPQLQGLNGGGGLVWCGLRALFRRGVRARVDFDSGSASSGLGLSIAGIGVGLQLALV